MIGEDEDRRFEPRPLAGWYYAGAAASFLFMALSCFAYVMHVAADPATLPPDQRYALLAEPRQRTSLQRGLLANGHDVATLRPVIGTIGTDC